MHIQLLPESTLKFNKLQLVQKEAVEEQVRQLLIHERQLVPDS